MKRKRENLLKKRKRVRTLQQGWARLREALWTRTALPSDMIGTVCSFFPWEGCELPDETNPVFCKIRELFYDHLWKPGCPTAFRQANPPDVIHVCVPVATWFERVVAFREALNKELWLFSTRDQNTLRCFYDYNMTVRKCVWLDHDMRFFENLKGHELEYTLPQLELIADGISRYSFKESSQDVLWPNEDLEEAKKTIFTNLQNSMKQMTTWGF